MSYEYRAQHFKNGAVVLKAYGTGTSQELPLEQIREQVPSIFAPGKHESRSAKFTFIPTGDVLLGLLREGFVATEVRQGGSRIEGKADFTKHTIRLRRRDDRPGTVGVSDTVYPEIVLSNAHDGTGAYILNAGLFRVLCKNGLVCSSSLSEVRLPHKGDIIDNVIEGVFRVVSDLPRAVDTANEWAQLNVSRPQAEAFARAAAQLRWAPKENDEGQLVNTAPVEVTQVLEAHRYGDQGNDIWRTFNRVQENLLGGGQRYIQRDEQGRRRAQRTVRAVNGVEQNKTLNQALWVLTEEFAKLAA